MPKILKKLTSDLNLIYLTMKQEKIMPRGADAPALDRTGVQRKTKMYMQLSTML